MYLCGHTTNITIFHNSQRFQFIQCIACARRGKIDPFSFCLPPKSVAANRNNERFGADNWVISHFAISLRFLSIQLDVAAKASFERLCFVHKSTESNAFDAVCVCRYWNNSSFTFCIVRVECKNKRRKQLRVCVRAHVMWAHFDWSQHVLIGRLGNSEQRQSPVIIIFAIASKIIAQND